MKFFKSLLLALLVMIPCQMLPMSAWRMGLDYGLNATKATFRILKNRTRKEYALMGITGASLLAGIIFWRMSKALKNHAAPDSQTAESWVEDCMKIYAQEVKLTTLKDRPGLCNHILHKSTEPEFVDKVKEDLDALKVVKQDLLIAHNDDSSESATNLVDHNADALLKKVETLIATLEIIDSWLALAAMLEGDSAALAFASFIGEAEAYVGDFEKNYRDALQILESKSLSRENKTQKLRDCLRLKENPGVPNAEKSKLKHYFKGALEKGIQEHKNDAKMEILVGRAEILLNKIHALLNHMDTIITQILIHQGMHN